MLPASRGSRARVEHCEYVVATAGFVLLRVVIRVPSSALSTTPAELVVIGTDGARRFPPLPGSDGVAGGEPGHTLCRVGFGVPVGLLEQPGQRAYLRLAGMGPLELAPEAPDARAPSLADDGRGGAASPTPGLEAMLQRSRSERAALQTELGRSRDQNAALAETIDQLREAVAGAESRATDSEQLAGPLRSRKVAVEDEADRLRRAATRASRRVVSLRERAAASERRVAVLSAKVTKARATRGRTGEVGRQNARRRTVLGVCLAVGVTALTMIAPPAARAPRAPQSEGAAFDLRAPLLAGVSAQGARDIPRDYLEAYKAAGERYHLDWALLAAIGKVESDHGRSPLPGVRTGSNRVGASGPMQIVRRTWHAYGVDADGDGRLDAYAPADAVFAAASYLRTLRASTGTDQALLAYSNGDQAAADAVAVAVAVKRYRAR